MFSIFINYAKRQIFTAYFSYFQWLDLLDCAICTNSKLVSFFHFCSQKRGLLKQNCCRGRVRLRNSVRMHCVFVPKNVDFQNKI